MLNISIKKLSYLVFAFGFLSQILVIYSSPFCFFFSFFFLKVASYISIPSTNSFICFQKSG